MTSDVTIYHIPSKYIKEDLFAYPCCINIVDTPGFGDTRGSAWDEKIEKMIAGLLHQLDSLDYLTICVKGSINRLDIPAKFIYETIAGMYGIDVSDRVLGMITFSDSSDDAARVALEAAGIVLHERFRFNNS